MNNERIAKELVEMAKSLTSSFEVKKLNSKEIQIRVDGKLKYSLTKEVGGRNWEVRGLGPKGTVRTYVNQREAIKAVKKAENVKDANSMTASHSRKAAGPVYRILVKELNEGPSPINTLALVLRDVVKAFGSYTYDVPGEDDVADIVDKIETLAIKARKAARDAAREDAEMSMLSSRTSSSRMASDKMSEKLR